MDAGVVAMTTASALVRVRQATSMWPDARPRALRSRTPDSPTEIPLLWLQLNQTMPGPALAGDPSTTCATRITGGKVFPRIPDPWPPVPSCARLWVIGDFFVVGCACWRPQQSSSRSANARSARAFGFVTTRRRQRRTSSRQVPFTLDVDARPSRHGARALLTSELGEVPEMAQAELLSRTGPMASTAQPINGEGTSRHRTSGEVR